MLHKSKQFIFLIVGHFFVALGIVGAFVPLLPTTPFLILAAFCYSRGSKRMHQWLLNRPHMGPAVRDWEQFGVIRPKAKIMATIAIVLTFGVTLYKVDVNHYVKAILVAMALGLLSFILTRPSRPR